MEPVKLGALFKNISSYGAAQLISPAENVNGAVIRTGTFIGASISVLTSGTAVPPKGTTDTTKPVIAAVQGQMTLPYPITLPAGYGLWFIANSGNGYSYVTYDLL